MWVFPCTLEKMEIKNIFQIQSIKHSIENWDVKKNKFEKDIKNLNFIENQFVTSRNVKQKINLNEIFKRNFKKELNLLEKTINNKLNLKNVWVVHYKQYQEHIIHNHGNSGLGGIIYLKYHNKLHEPTRYLMPLNDLVSENSLIYNEQVEEGDILIMPSFIHHYSSINRSEEVRSIIGFDLEFVK
jgi:cupin superfamily acireductone dioxygenase involved in methionine salvage